MSTGVVRVGCPVWSHDGWRGTFFTPAARREDYLGQYGSVFGTCEGNSTFYGLPSAATVHRWAREVPPGLRLCFKFPRTVSHDRALVGADALAEEFLQRMEPLRANLGPFLLQLHNSFGPDRLPALDAFLQRWAAHGVAVEVRHAAFFDGGAHEAALDGLLRERGAERCVFDTGGLFASAAADPLTLDAKRRKPKVPWRSTAIGRTPVVRYVGDPEPERNRTALRRWAAIAVAWAREGRNPHLFLHHPDDGRAPALVRVLQQELHACAPGWIPPPPRWPAEGVQREEQLELL
jgi:uncharacterized protein YecE (DUF72 family)